ncbi:MAG TPA: hypothetical protein VMR70_01040 [Flavisolibacter sp.]|nr:hypothetical protein [Flavisolibacter sp.]
MNEELSLFERYRAQLEQEKKIRELTGPENMQILQELSAGMDDFNNQQRQNERQSEMELASIMLH